MNEIVTDPIKSDVKITKVYHKGSLLLEAVSNGRLQMVKYLLEVYKTKYFKHTKWQWNDKLGLWRDFDSSTQEKIQQSKFDSIINLQFGDELSTVDLKSKKQILNGGLERKIRQVIKPIARIAEDKQDNETETFTEVILSSSDFIYESAESLEMVQLLVDEGVVDPTAWYLPCDDSSSFNPLYLPNNTNAKLDKIFMKWCSNILSRSGVSNQMNLLDIKSNISSDIQENRRRDQSRLTDGLETAPSLDITQESFYPKDYVTHFTPLAFISELPNNNVGYNFPIETMHLLMIQCLCMWGEISRQNYTITKPNHAFSIYIYTYEAKNGDQIYAAMNAAMRNTIKDKIEFWRPLIYCLDNALLSLPEYKGKLYRGINLRFPEAFYREGCEVRWPSFSSSSSERRVAEEFSGTGDGTLFFLTSIHARDVRWLSRYPKECEVLFRPNTNFVIKSRLMGNTDIGSFYSRCDNIAMDESLPKDTDFVDLIVRIPQQYITEGLEHLHQTPHSISVSQSIDTKSSQNPSKKVDDRNSNNFCVPMRTSSVQTEMIDTNAIEFQGQEPSPYIVNILDLKSHICPTTPTFKDYFGY
eukprot:NODE_670_length_2483_cov_34.441102_g575_i0.p1 GENE.NODE_670_length_2483_cov_34.441102_g575_i0~~NODE_670_length_2483_cov_34.441102_g575_i0.p1  ORF type:complete len:584 (-),score=80.61 NODE_670_length_2483_cov_34.441102_g575_i0:104-1855(-)